MCSELISLIPFPNMPQVWQSEPLASDVDKLIAAHDMLCVLEDTLQFSFYLATKTVGEELSHALGCRDLCQMAIQSDGTDVVASCTTVNPVSAPEAIMMLMAPQSVGGVSEQDHNNVAFIIQCLGGNS